MKENDPALHKLAQLQYFINESAQVCMKLAQLHKKLAQLQYFINESAQVCMKLAQLHKKDAQQVFSVQI
jgi:hypothetical protein